jgi:hypothetical protein
VAIGVFAVVSGGGDDDNAGVHGLAGGQGQRIGLVRLVHSRRDRQVDHADIERVPMMDRVVDRGDDIADHPVAAAVEDLERDEVRGRRDPGTGARGVEAVAGHDPGHVRAVAVVVVRHLTVVDEIDEGIDARRAGGRVEQVVMVGGAGIDDRDSDARPVVAELLTHDIRADGRAGSFHHAHDRAIKRDASDELVAGESRQRAVRHVDHDAVDDGQ